MKRLLWFEFLQLRRNFIILIILVLIFLMYKTQCLPKKWYWYAKPMDEMHLFYITMIEDYSGGFTQEFKNEKTGITICRKIQLTEANKNLFLKSIRIMNPNFNENNIYDEIIFDLSQNEFEIIMDEISQALGENNYYNDSTRLIFYKNYVSSAFNIDTSLSISKKTKAMEDYLDYIIHEKCYSKFTELSVKKVNLTNDTIIYLSNIYAQMQKTKIEAKDINTLYDLYDTWFLEIDDVLKGNTAFGYKYRQFVFNLRNSLEKETELFENIKNKDKFTNTYARYYSDYMIILAGILPALLGAFTLIEDRKYKIHEFIYSNRVSSNSYVISKFLAIVILFGVYFCFIAAISTVLFHNFGQTFNYEIDYLAFLKYTILWVMPTVLFTTALSMFLSLCFQNGIIPLAIQLIIFFKSAQPLIGDYKIYKPIIRYNEIRNYEFYQNNLVKIISNRTFISVFSIIILYITIKIHIMIRKNDNFLSSYVYKMRQWKERRF